MTVTQPIEERLAGRLPFATRVLDRIRHLPPRRCRRDRVGLEGHRIEVAALVKALIQDRHGLQAASPGTGTRGRPPRWVSIFGRRQREDDKPIPARSRAASFLLAENAPMGWDAARGA
jgi:hypothetical protein